jgi:hypothetical protein
MAYVIRRHFQEHHSDERHEGEPPAHLIERVGNPKFIAAFYPSTVRRVELIRIDEVIVAAADRADR